MKPPSVSVRASSSSLLPTKVTMMVTSMLLFLILMLLPEAQSSEPGRQPIRILSSNRAPRRRISGASKPVVIRIRPPDAPPAGRIMSNMPPSVPQSPILRIKPVIRFHKEQKPTENATRSAEQLNQLLEKIGLTKMAFLLRRASLGHELLTVGPVTIFAPTDDAFALAPRGFVQTLVRDSDNRQMLRNFLLHHIIRGNLHPEDIRNDFTMSSTHPSAAPLRFNVYADGQVITVSGAEFLNTPSHAESVLVQPIDRILYPFAETDLVGVARRNFKEMHDLLLEAGLAEQLSSGTFTLFLPTDEAFAALPQRARQLLLNNSTLLRKVVLNHVVPGTYFSASLSNGFRLKPLGGEPLVITTRRGLIMVNGVPIIRPDNPSTNGVVHGINRVLVPEELIEQCRCMTKYPTAPATLRPSLPPSSKTSVIDASKNGETDREPSFGTRLKPLPPSSTSTSDHPVTTMPQSEKSEKPLLEMLGNPAQLPNGRKLTFDTGSRLFRDSLLIARLRNPGSKGLTILLPTDAAFQRLPPDTRKAMTNSSDPKALTRLLSGHALEGNLDPTTLRSDVPVKTLAGGTLLLKVLPERKGILIGGVPVILVRRGPQGTVLAVDRVLDPPPPENSDVSDGMRQPQLPVSAADRASAVDPDRMSIWRKIIDDLPDVKRQLKSRDNVYTMFAPTNSAFSRLAPDELSKLLSSEELKKDLVRGHVTFGAIYRTMLTPDIVATSLKGNKLHIERIAGGIRVNSVPASRPPIVTSNGIVYEVDNLIFLPTMSRALPDRLPGDTQTADKQQYPTSGGTLEDIASKHDATTFLKWINASGLRNAIRDNRPCTVFLPTNRAIASMSPTLRMVTISDMRALRRIVQYHICLVPLSSREAMIAQNEVTLPTLLPRKPIRCNAYWSGNTTALAASGCPVSDVLPTTDDGVNVVIVNKTLSPPVGDLLLTASKSPMLRNFTKIARVAGVDLQDGETWTVFAPSKCAFARMPPEKYQKLLTDPEAARAFVLRHVVKGSVYTNGMFDGMSLSSREGTSLRISTQPNCILVNGVKLKYGDLSATNGVLHIISDELP